MPAQQPSRTNRRRSKGGPRGHLLDVQIRSSTARRRRQEQIGRWVWNLCFVAIFGAAAFLGIRMLLDRFFFQNADYTLKRITLNLDDVLTREEALSKTGLQEGMNIFSVDLARVQAALEAVPQVQEVHIERQLPDHLSISLTSRRPVAWVAGDGEDPTASGNSLLVDEDGYLMRPHKIRPEYYHLPVITGVKSDNIRAGEPLSNADLKRALELIDATARHPECLLRIRSLDISRGYRIDVVNDGNAHIAFAASDFEEQLGRLRKLLIYCRENDRTLDSVNLMVKRNTPVTFVVAQTPAEEVRPEKKSPSNPASKTRRN